MIKGSGRRPVVGMPGHAESSDGENGAQVGVLALILEGGGGGLLEDM